MGGPAGAFFFWRASRGGAVPIGEGTGGLERFIPAIFGGEGTLRPTAAMGLALLYRDLSLERKARRFVGGVAGPGIIWEGRGKGRDVKPSEIMTGV